MIRPASLLCALLAFGSGLYLYQSKHRAQLLDREIARTVKDTGAAVERINRLKAEYQDLNEPERLQGLAQHFLPIRPMGPAQTVTMADLGQHLPAPLPASAFAPPAEDAATVVAAVVPAAGPMLLAGLAPVPRPAVRISPSVPPVAAAVVAAAAPPPPPPRPVAEPAPRPAVLRRAPEPPPLAFGPAVAAPLAPAVPLMPRPALVQRVVAGNLPFPVASGAPSASIVTAAVSPIAFPSAPPAVASALGMGSRTLLPPPVPMH